MIRKILISGKLYKALFSGLKVLILFCTLFGASLSLAASYLDEVRAQEPKQLEKFKGRARRDGSLLMLKTVSGAYVTFAETLGCDPMSWCRYIFIDYFRDQGFYVVFMRTHEGDTHTMISEKDGKEYFVMEPPQLSPDRKRVVTASASDYEDENGVFIWRMEDGLLISELSYKPSSKGSNANYYYFKRWKDNKTIEVYKHFHANKILCSNSNIAEIEMTLRLEDGAWKVYEDLNDQPVNCNPEKRW